ncbi:MAG: CDP-glycerol glycerophosphotransferase family protein [Lachnospiraceae bacterium]|nr:CDP-glycerol glycerophosphotransferase family protein [Lachnospiraceae bacterium]
MKRLLHKIKRKSKKLLKEAKVFKPANYSRARYFWYREHCPVEEKTILLEVVGGDRPADNTAALLEELASGDEYKEYSVYLAGGKSVCKARKNYIKQQGMSGRVKILSVNSLSYYKILATAKYLVSEDSFIYIFTKRPEQVYLNIWHGTPLMTMGKSKKTDYAMVGNEQKNFFDADFLLCQNEYAMNHMTEDYMLENFAKTKIWLSGSPRNEVFHHTEVREKVRAACNFGEKQVIAYLPTWRKNTKEFDKEAYSELFTGLLKEWDDKLSEQQEVYVKQHPVNPVEVDFSKYRHIKPFPAKFGTYEFLVGADVLVTDYSSVLFDFAITGKKIVLFTHDKERYEEIRGLHMELSELPFPKADTVEALAEELALPKQYNDTAFLEKFCSYDKLNVTKAICHKFLFGEESKLIEQKDIPYNGKKNVVLYIGGFEKNGLTTAGVNLLHTLDRTKNNYAVLYCMTSVKGRQESIRVIPEDVSLIGFYYYRALTFKEQVPYMLWRGFPNNVPYSKVAEVMKRLSIRGAERMMGGCRIDTVVQFTGYNDEMIGSMEQMPCNRIIYVHSDMEKEIKLRANANAGLLSHAYKKYDSVAAVTEGMIPPAKRIAESFREAGAPSPNFALCRNVIDHKRIRRLGEQELQFDETTVLNVEEEKLLEALVSNKKKFISIGRFSIEKGHERLIKAFERLHKEQPDTCLFIIGGHGDLWNKTMQQVEESSCPDAVFLIRYMSNPYPLVKQCDYFVLSSLYEGFGLVLAEADILGLPCFSTNIDGPRGFMQKYGGLLVADNENGLLEGMHACLNGKIADKLNIDYEQYNKEAVEQFEALL